MKKNLTLIILITLHISLFTIHLNSQPCLPEGINLYSQTQINSFQINYPNCTEIEGDVKIGLVFENDITNLNGLNNLGKIGGDLIIDRTNLSNLNGLENIDSIMGDLHLEFNGNLINLAGLWNLSFIGGSFTIISCEDLSSLTALGNLNFIGEDINIHNNNDLPNFTGLENITQVSRDLILTSNGNTLNSLTGLHNISSIGRDLLVRSNYGLLNLEGLDNLSYVGGIFEIRSNNHMTSLIGVENLDTVVGGLIITNVNKITSLEGLENLNLIEGDLRISGNELLTSIAELESIDASSVSNLYIAGNEALSECHVQYVCDYLASPTGSINIYNNGVGCNTPLEVADSCNIELECLPNGNYYFLSQESIDSFQDMYPDCTDLMGSVTIRGSNITNLSGLNNITSIEEDLSILQNDSLLNLTGLDNLTTIEEDLSIWQNDSLLNLTGLDNLTTIGGSLSFAKIIIVEQAWIIGNQNLNSLNGLESLNKIGENLFIGGSQYLQDLNGLNELDSIGGDFEIARSNGLLNLSGLEQLKKIKGSLRFGLNITGIEGEVHGNQSLNDISALNNITHVGGEISIWGNHALTSLTGLNNIDAASITGGLRILENGSLSTCHVNSICNYLTSPVGVVEINNNASGCNSPEEIEEACDTLFIEEFNIDTKFTIYPNPFSNIITIEFELFQPEIVTITIYNHLGEQVETIEKEPSKGKQQIIWNAEKLTAGIYFCVLKSNDGIQTTKMIKL